MRNYKLERLQNGESFITSEKGNSMVPLIKSGQKHMIEPATWEEVQVGDIAYCKVKGNWYTHLVTAKNEKRGCQISNNRGNVNGWTKAVYGVVVEVIDGKHKRKKQNIKKMKYIYSIRNNPGGVMSIFNSMTIEERVTALIDVVTDIKVSYEDADDELKYRLSGDLVNENVEKFLLNYKDYLDCIKEFGYVDDKKERVKMISKKLED